ncbi:Co2+/Mg2+ efflux protein ApaG [Marinimicrococcus flavescens]|uniref:Protein ApaG n=1 Tax=Marinimicrococcus flavescens TaxID=3031815 RepID=A0AAP3UZ40_9PROT|nr:Co2+/Mg2+ efflux protein ApaG [Marinimicrococcus flavescens]
MYDAVTLGIRVTVEPFFIEEQSQPPDTRWMFGYRITISNGRREPVQLLSRHWRITDARGQSTEVRGQGVVGKQPRIEPGASFEYTSGAPLATPSGIMAGSYRMVTDKGAVLDVDIPTFSLDTPGRRSRPN